MRTGDSLPHPVVAPSPDAAPFWDAARRRELHLPYCRSCERFFFYPRALCPTCGSRQLEWRPVSGRGRLHSFCIHHASALPSFREALPFVTALVELEEGPRVMSLLIDVQPEASAIQCDMPLEVDFVDVDAGEMLPVFRPAGHVT